MVFVCKGLFSFSFSFKTVCVNNIDNDKCELIRNRVAAVDRDREKTPNRKGEEEKTVLCVYFQCQSYKNELKILFWCMYRNCVWVFVVIDDKTGNYLYRMLFLSNLLCIFMEIIINSHSLKFVEFTINSSI